MGGRDGGRRAACPNAGTGAGAGAESSGDDGVDGDIGEGGGKGVDGQKASSPEPLGCGRRGGGASRLRRSGKPASAAPKLGLRIERDRAREADGGSAEAVDALMAALTLAAAPGTAACSAGSMERIRFRDIWRDRRAERTGRCEKEKPVAASEP
jgi:hypothetical protein